MGILFRQMSSLLKGVTSILGSKAVNVLSSLLIIPILVRIVGSSGYGKFAFMMSFISISTIIVNFGLFDGIRKFIAEDRSIEDWSDRVFSFYFRFGIALAAIASVLIVISNASGVIQIAVGDGFVNLFFIASAVILFKQLSMIVRGTFMGFKLESLSESLQIFRQLVYIALGLGLAYLGYGVAGVLVGLAIGFLLSTLIGLVYLRKYIDFGYLLKPHADSLPTKELLKFNGHSVMLVLLIQSLYNVDILLLQPFAGSTVTGYYQAALKIAEFVWFIPFTIQIALLHRTSELWAEDEIEKITGLAAKITRYVVSLAVMIAIGIAVLSDEFVPLYFGKEFSRSITPLLILLPGALGFAIARPIYSISQGNGQLQPLIIATMVAAFANIVLNILFIPRFGMYGAAAATSISYGGMVVLHVVTARRIGYDPLADLRLRQIVILVMVAAPVVYGADILITSPILSLVLVPLVGLVTYVFLFIHLGIASDDDKKRMKRYAREVYEPKIR